RREFAHRVLESETCTLHEEAEYIARLAAAEALVEALRGLNVERRCLLVMERAQRAELLAGALQVHLFADDLHDIGATAHLVDQMLRDHRSSSTVTPAPPSPTPPGRCDR